MLAGITMVLVLPGSALEKKTACCAYALDVPIAPEADMHHGAVETESVAEPKMFALKVQKVWSGDTQEEAAALHLWCSYEDDEGKLSFDHPNNVKLTADKGWTYQWNDLPLYTTGGEPYTYYVAEEYIDGYSTSYNTERQTIPEVGLAAVVPMEQVRSGEATIAEVTVTNTAAGKPARKDGVGTAWLIFGGLVLLMAAIYIFVRPRRRKETD